jgi:hypothetical protein
MVTFLRLVPMSRVDKDIEILALRHQLAVLQRHVDKPPHPARAGVPRRSALPPPPAHPAAALSAIFE